MQDGWIGLAWLAVSWYPVTVHHAGWVYWAGLVSTVPWYPVDAGWVEWAGLVSSALVSSGSPPCGMGVLGWPG